MLLVRDLASIPSAATSGFAHISGTATMAHHDDDDPGTTALEMGNWQERHWI
jgi:hypothetical protein